MDDDLREWEVYATTGRYGFPDRARVMFRCMSDPHERTRALALQGDKSDAEAAVETASAEELTRMMEEAETLD